jgi:hypothetical protein
MLRHVAFELAVGDAANPFLNIAFESFHAPSLFQRDLRGGAYVDGHAFDRPRLVGYIQGT